LRVPEGQRHDVTRLDVGGHLEPRTFTPADTAGMVDLEGHVSAGDNADRRSDHAHTGTGHFEYAGLADMVSETLDRDEVTVREDHQVVRELRQVRRQRTDLSCTPSQQQRQTSRQRDTHWYRNPTKSGRTSKRTLHFSAF